MKVISIANQKGGVGKTSTALALANGLSLEGYKVLSIDLDPQGNLTACYGAKKGLSALSLLTEEANINQVIQWTSTGDIVPYSAKLSNIEALLEDTGKEYKLKESLEDLKDYDYVILDTPPSLGLITINSLTASDYVIIPTVADLFSIQGLDGITKTINTIKKYTNPKLEVGGILISMYSGRTNVDKEAVKVIELLAKQLDTTPFKNTIRVSCKVKEAAFEHKGILTYAPGTKIANDYTGFIKELHERGI